MEKCFKEIDICIYPKRPNSWIHNTSFKHLLLILIFQCEINPLFFLLRILSIFNIHRGRGDKVLVIKLSVSNIIGNMPYIKYKIV